MQRPHHSGFSGCRLQTLQALGATVVGLLAPEQRLSSGGAWAWCCAARGISRPRGLNLCLTALADEFFTLSHQESPIITFLTSHLKFTLVTDVKEKTHTERTLNGIT